MNTPTRKLDYQRAYMDLVFSWADIHERHQKLLDYLDDFATLIRMGDFVGAERLKLHMQHIVAGETVT